MKKISFFLLYVLFAISVMGQGKLVFEEKDHNFGNIQEKGGHVSHDFTFTNEGTEPVVITNVSASCGCTTPNWSRDPIPPKGKSTISVQFNPLGRVGLFSKSITIYNNSIDKTVVLHINGTVLAKPQDPPIQGFEAKYQINDAAALKASTEFNAFITRVVDVCNKQSNITLQIEASASKHQVKVAKSPEELALLRANKLEKTILDALKAKGIDASQVTLKKISHVQGPDFSEQNKKKKEIFLPYEYVKVLQIP